MNKYLSNSRKLITQLDIDLLENTYGILAEEYKKLLLRENGGVASLKNRETDFVFYCLDKDSSIDLREQWLDWHQSDVLPIAEDASKNLLLLNVTNGEIFYKNTKAANSITEFLTENCMPIFYEDNLIDCIVNSNHDELERLILKNQINRYHRFNDNYTLPMYAVLASNESALKILSRYGFDFSGVLHLMLGQGSCNLVLIKAVLEGGADIFEKNHDGLTISDIDSPWVDTIIDMYHDMK